MAISQSVLPVRAFVTAPDLADDPDIFPRLRGQQPPKKGAQWSTTALKSKSGRAFRKQNFSYPIWVFSTAYSTLAQKPTRMDLDRLTAFFNRRAGQFGDFFYYDPYDNVVSGAAIGVGDGVTRQFQLMRTVRDGSHGWSEPVFVLNGPPLVTVDGLPTSNFEIVAPGIIEFAVAPSAPTPHDPNIIAWSGSFLFWCRFTQDELDVQRLNALLWSNDGLAFETVKA